MATEPTAQAIKQPMTALELIAFVKNELDADDERQAKVSAASAGELLRESQTGSTLDLSHKNINALPVDVVLLIKDRVERLALSHNPRIALPIEIGQCDRLRYLNLRWNKLKHFPEAVLTLHKLEILDISKNAIDSIPEDIKKMTSLKFLAVARNQIKRLPYALGEMNLVKLKFDENPIEFPPPEALKPSKDPTNSSIESEKDKNMCQQVKRYMKDAMKATAAMREGLQTNSDEDVSASSVETPRPPRRGAHGGRFPVRPSLSGIGGTNLKAESPPDTAPPIPQRSHARGLSSASQMARRPGVTPLSTGLDTNRSRSESVASTNMKSRRQGYVARKNTTTGEMSSQLSSRSIQPPTLTPPHSRAPSMTSSFNSFLTIGSSGENSSGAVSPIDGPVSRALLTRKLASLPESRNSRPPIINSIKVVKRVLLMLVYLARPIADIAKQLSSGIPRSTLERQLLGANVHVEELDHLIKGANTIIEDHVELEPALLMSITRAATTALTLYVQIIKELHRNRQQMAKRVDAFHIRCVINTAYSTLIEARNVCHMLGFQTKTSAARTLRASNAWSSRTVTPTQPRSSSSRRRGATILPHSGGISSLRGAPAPPVPLHINGSRSNTMTSSGGATPRLNDALNVLSSYSNVSSRNNTMRSGISEHDGEDSADRLYRKLQSCCDLAMQILPPVRAELASRKVGADKIGHSRSAHQYAQAINKCDCVIATNNKLLSRLKAMRVDDPARYLPEFRQLAESFSKDWANFGGEIMSLAHNRIEIGNIKHNLKPVQYAVKDATRAVRDSLQPSHTLSTKPPPTAGLHGGFPLLLNTSMAYQTSQPPPVPATPLGAALGPAVQATVPPTPNTAFNSPEFFPTQHVPGPSRSGPARIDPMLPPPGYPRR